MRVRPAANARVRSLVRSFAILCQRAYIRTRRRTGEGFRRHELHRPNLLARKRAIGRQRPCNAEIRQLTPRTMPITMHMQNAGKHARARSGQRSQHRDGCPTRSMPAGTTHRQHRNAHARTRQFQSSPSSNTFCGLMSPAAGGRGKPSNSLCRPPVRRSAAHPLAMPTGCNNSIMTNNMHIP